MITFSQLRRRGVPLVGYETHDPKATMLRVERELNGKGDETPILHWDCVRGLSAFNEAGEAALATVAASDEEKSMSRDPALSLRLAEKMPKGCVLFYQNAHHFLKEPMVAQAAWNLRDLNKSKAASLVMLAPAIDLPSELRQDVLVMTEKVPGPDEIKVIAESLFDEARAFGKDKRPSMDRLTDTLLGYLSAFAIEQALAVSLSKEGVDMERLWSLKVQALRQVSGLEVLLPTENFSNLAGCAGVKAFMTAYLNGREKPRTVLFWDEIEKMVAGTMDTSGTTQALLEQFLYWTEARKVKGILLVGVPGAGKTATARCTAGQAGIPLLRASMSTVKGSLVGQSEGQMKALLASVDAVGQGRVLMIATCNSVDALPPEMMARFKLATFFYDYPTDEERDALWSYYTAKYEIKDKKQPESGQWVGREVESCCERAWLFNTTLEAAAKSVVPIRLANAAKMDLLRRSASGRFLSAATPGVYQCTSTEALHVKEQLKRKVEV